MRPEVQAVLDGLSPAEKSEVLQHVARELGDVHPRIELTPGVCGGSPRIAGTRIPVWLLESYRRLGASDAELLNTYPSLQPRDLAAAWAFVAMQTEMIEREIAEQNVV